MTVETTASPWPKLKLKYAVSLVELSLLRMNAAPKRSTVEGLERGG